MNFRVGCRRLAIVMAVLLACPAFLFSCLEAGNTLPTQEDMGTIDVLLGLAFSLLVGLVAALSVALIFMVSYFIVVWVFDWLRAGFSLPSENAKAADGPADPEAGGPSSSGQPSSDRDVSPV
jgi:hypothetical protein